MDGLSKRGPVPPLRGVTCHTSTRRVSAVGPHSFVNHRGLALRLRSGPPRSVLSAIRPRELPPPSTDKKIKQRI